MFGLVETLHQLVTKFDYEREFLELSDGGMIALDWFLVPDEHGKTDRLLSTKPLIAMIPGLTGDHTKMYMLSTIKRAQKKGYDVVIVNYRGLAGVPLKVTIS
jgi:predicted alpha/beta-fold hydrolase